MSPTRRDVFKIASALGLAGALPSTAERVAAVHLLDQDVSTHPLLDPGTFALEVDGLLGGRLDDAWLSSINAEQYAHYVQALESVKREVSFLGTKEAFHVYNDWEASVFNFIMASYDAGLRHGAAYEGLRRAVVGEVTVCEDCRGVGITGDGNTCSTCGGTGTVALSA